MRSKYLLVLISLIPTLGFTQSAPKPDPIFIDSAFQRADHFMDLDHYDSAQVWLNKIHSLVSYKKPSLFSYFLTSRQAEVYYYNNLHQLGFQEAEKAEYIAKVLGDSLLLADAYNFLGLFQLNKNEPEKAVQYFKLALHYFPANRPQKGYIPLSERHHIYGNLAETFEKENLPDSSIFYCRLSLKEASKINSGRGKATAALNLALAFELKKQTDSARKYFLLTNVFARESLDFDVELTSYSGLALCAKNEGKRPQAFDQLQKGFALIDRYPQLNDFYSAIFLDAAIEIYRFYKVDQQLVSTLQLKSDLQKATYERNNTQIQTLLAMGIDNEKTIFKLELADAKNVQRLATTRVYILLMLLLLIIIAFIAYRYYILQRLKLADLRSKIGRDLHDEVGATLSGIAMYSYITKEQLKNKEEAAVEHSLNVIKNNASEMVEKLNDIVWAVNPTQDHLSAMLERLREFAFQLTGAKSIHLNFSIPEDIKSLKLSMEQRQNSYLICKEAINNAVKYSQTEDLLVISNFNEGYLTLKIQDFGVGFEQNVSSKGNGLVNMQSRANEIGATLTINSNIDSGTAVTLVCKIT